jgi:hypothetical protein
LKPRARGSFALETLRSIPYDKWGEYDAEDTIRFYALHLHEAGMIKSDQASGESHIRSKSQKGPSRYGRPRVLRADPAR